MTDLLLKDIDPALARRILDLAEKCGWSQHFAILNLLEHGLAVLETEGRRSFDTSEAEALSRAIAALQELPAGPSF